ncbi:MAG: hypothetical protein RLZZ350_34 [Verrucomicrobiota bacterium]|jgi:hypothetical protein
MKKILFACSLVTTLTVHAQLPVYESFNYATGALAGKGAWATSVSAVQVSAGSLDGSAVNLSNSVGNKVTVTGGTAGFNASTKEDFVTADVTSGSFYFSFLFKLTDATGIDTVGTGTPILHLNQRSSGTKVLTSILLFNDAGHVRVGIGKHAGAAAIAASGFTASGNGAAIEDGTVYLIVGKYQFNSGAANDTVSLWVNPASLGGSEDASPKISALTGGADGVGIGRCYVAQGFNGALDELRFGATWADVTPSLVCISASITAGPTNQNAYINGTANFSVTANGSGVAYQWQFSTDNGANWNNVASGGNAASYTTPTLTLADNGEQFRCRATVNCGGGSFYTSVYATLTVTDPTGFSFRSFTSGNWNATSTWEQSTNGTTWFPATSTPNYLNSNLTVRASHVVTVTAPVTVDDLTIQAGGEVDALDAALTLNDGAAAVDANVLGVLQVANATNSALIMSGSAGLTFGNGGRYVWASSFSTSAIPVAIWADGSTCEIANGNNSQPTGLAQNFYDFFWSRTSAGQVSLGGQLQTVRHNLTMRGSASAVNSVRFLQTGLTCNLTVGNDFIVDAGNVTFSGGSVANTVLNIFLGGNFVVQPGATIDSRTSNAGTPVGDEVNLNFTNTAHAQSIALAGATVAHTGDVGGCPVFWRVWTNVTVTLVGGNLQLTNAYQGSHDTVIVDGILNCGGNQITGTAANAGALVINNGGTLVGENSTAQITASLAAITYGGTLRLPNLPNNLNNGDGFKLFDATSYSGAFTSISPSTTPTTSFAWDTTQLPVSGYLYAGSASIPVPHFTSSTISGGNFVASGTGGAPNGTFSVITTTNPALPTASWTTQATGLSFDGSGNFIYSNAVGAGYLFYRIAP